MEISKILLIVPSTNKVWKKELKNKIGTAPLGVAIISSVLRFQGYEVKMIDMLVEHSTPADIKQYIEEFKPDVIGVSASYTESINITYKIIKYIKKITNVKLIAGGVHVTFRPEEALQSGFDYVILHEGEATWIELLEYMKAESTCFDQIEGIAFMRDGQFHMNKARDFITELDALPFPDLLSLPLEEYVTPLALITSRGCPGDCIYCSSRAMSGKRYRMRSAESVFSEVFYFSNFILYDKRLVKSYLAIYDDTFTVNKTRLNRFCDYMISSGFNLIPWKCESRIDILNEEIIKKMKEAGCFALHVGVESSDQDIINSLNKHIKISKVEEILALLKKYEIRPLCSFIIGNHKDTKETLDKTFAYIKHIIRDYGAQVATSPNTPLPGTSLYEHASDYNIQIHSDNWDDFSLMKVILSTEYLSTEDIRDACYSIVKEINEIGG